jgi:hypothetical protein
MQASKATKALTILASTVVGQTARPYPWRCMKTETDRNTHIHTQTLADQSFFGYEVSGAL